jgi:hypothetical protein
VSYISTDTSIVEPSHRHAWRADDGTIHATVRLSSESATFLSFDSPADARAVAAACIEAAEAMDRLADGDQP